MFQGTNLYELEKLAAEIGIHSTFVYTDQKMQSLSGGEQVYARPFMVESLQIGLCL